MRARDESLHAPLPGVDQACVLSPEPSGVRTRSRSMYVCYDAGMRYFGKITGMNNGVEGTWLVELDDDGVPTREFVLIPPEAMPDVVPVWAIQLKESPDPKRAFTRDEVRRIALIKMRRSMDRLKGRDAGS